MPSAKHVYLDDHQVERVLVQKFNRPQPSARLVEFLASQGYVTPDEAGVLAVFWKFAECGQSRFARCLSGS